MCPVALLAPSRVKSIHFTLKLTLFWNYLLITTAVQSQELSGSLQYFDGVPHLHTTDGIMPLTIWNSPQGPIYGLNYAGSWYRVRITHEMPPTNHFVSNPQPPSPPPSYEQGGYVSPPLSPETVYNMPAEQFQPETIPSPAYPVSYDQPPPPYPGHVTPPVYTAQQTPVIQQTHPQQHIIAPFQQHSPGQLPEIAPRLSTNSSSDELSPLEAAESDTIQRSENFMLPSVVTLLDQEYRSFTRSPGNSASVKKKALAAITGVTSLTEPKKKILDTTPEVQRRPFKGSPFKPDLSDGGKHLNESAVRCLEDSVAILEIPNAILLSSDCLQDLPRKLIRLTLTHNNKIDSSGIQYLPRTLTELDLHDNLNITDACCSYFPRTLQLLNLGKNQKLTDAGIALLPEELEQLILTDNKKITGESFAKMPPGLVRLDLGSVTKVNDTQLLLLPSTLERLDLSSVKFSDSATIGFLDRFPDMTVLMLASSKKITDVSVSRLPPKLTKLVLSSCSLSDHQQACGFSPFLKELDIRSSKKIGGEYFKNLPKRLELLDISSVNIDDRDLEWLPRSILTLFLSGSVDLANSYLHNLPPHLIMLDLSKNSGISDSGIKFLPRTLTSLDLSSNKNVSSASVRLLPPALTFLSLKSSKLWDDGAIAHLPRSLTHLDLSSAGKLTPACANDFPPRLQLTILHSDVRRWTKKNKVPGVPTKK